eukprot:gnl/MRDRNA2_/MRDRNA2_115781_c0_seq1.p1 gnl/MRDRNA2_/MRDRNA2_115781_c0~~gnl/MRDRNA2_/MRDRNA2_115781_c0_seq1.p1  ORF type:complete len:312 (-),score=63.94 gnl/MRDRNA2_/MRDRNA2_115781_c0_seq1:269-1150(-)
MSSGKKRSKPSSTGLKTTSRSRKNKPTKPPLPTYTPADIPQLPDMFHPFFPYQASRGRIKTKRRPLANDRFQGLTVTVAPPGWWKGVQKGDLDKADVEKKEQIMIKQNKAWLGIQKERQEENKLILLEAKAEMKFAQQERVKKDKEGRERATERKRKNREEAGLDPDPPPKPKRPRFWGPKLVVSHEEFEEALEKKEREVLGPKGARRAKEKRQADFDRFMRKRVPGMGKRPSLLFAETAPVFVGIQTAAVVGILVGSAATMAIAFFRWAPFRMGKKLPCTKYKLYPTAFLYW